MTHFFSNLADGNLMLFRGLGLHWKEHSEQLALPMLHWTSNTRSRCVIMGQMVIMDAGLMNKVMDSLRMMLRCLSEAFIWWHLSKWVMSTGNAWLRWSLGSESKCHESGLRGWSVVSADSSPPLPSCLSLRRSFLHEPGFYCPVKHEHSVILARGSWGQRSSAWALSTNHEQLLFVWETRVWALKNEKCTASKPRLSTWRSLQMRWLNLCSLIE